MWTVQLHCLLRYAFLPTEYFGIMHVLRVAAVTSLVIVWNLVLIQGPESCEPATLLLRHSKIWMSA